MSQNVDIPKLAFPIRRGVTGRLIVVEQDSDADVAGNVEVVARTTPGERLERLDFGVPDMLLAEVREGQAAAVLDAIIDAEPRFAGTVTENPTELDAMMRVVQVRQESTNGR